MCLLSVSLRLSEIRRSAMALTALLAVLGAMSAQGTAEEARPGSWKLAEETACKEDVRRFCPSYFRHNNLAVLQWLQDAQWAGGGGLSPDCNHILWNYKLNLTTEPDYESVARGVCWLATGSFPECAKKPVGKGYLVPCLVEQQPRFREYHCTRYITKMAAVVYPDYRQVAGFIDHCRDDIGRLRCGRVGGGPRRVHSQSEVVACLEKRLGGDAAQLSRGCREAILRVSELSSDDDFHADRPLYSACRDDRERFCEAARAGDGRVYECLSGHRLEESMSEECRGALVARQHLVPRYFGISYSLAKACNSELWERNCSTSNFSLSAEGRLADALLCLGSGGPASRDCLLEMTQQRIMLMEEVSLTPEILVGCRGEIERQCSGLQRKGHTLYCLMRVVHGEQGGGGSDCKRAIQTLIQANDPGGIYRMHRALDEACAPIASAACKPMLPSDPRLVSCLITHLYTEEMAGECAPALLDMQYTFSQDWKLAPEVYSACAGDALSLCYARTWNTTGESVPPGAVFACLFGRVYSTEELTRMLSPGCRRAVQGVLNVNLEPDVRDWCMIELGKWCAAETESGKVQACMEDHLYDLPPACWSPVENTDDLESEDIHADTLIKACEHAIELFCHNVSDAGLDSGELMDCLIQSKSQKEMPEECALGVTRFQPRQMMRDFRASSVFKEACQADALKRCRALSRKVDVVICLSNVVWREQGISHKCLGQVRAAEMAMAEDLRLQPALYEACKSDVHQLCPNVSHGNAASIECLKDNKKRLTWHCHQRVFKLQEREMSDSRLDYTLLRACKQAQDKYCSPPDSKYVFLCLKQNMEFIDPMCKRVIIKRQITQYADYRLNTMLRKACTENLAGFFQLDQDYRDDDLELEGRVTAYLKLQFASQRLSPDCEDTIRDIIRESALDFRLDPQLKMHCSDEISKLCPEEAVAEEQTGQLWECLKVNLLRIKTTMCKNQVLNMVRDGKADIFVDPVLWTTCASAIHQHCSAIPPGKGRQASCLMEALEDPHIQLQPECTQLLTDRRNLWSFAAQTFPPEGYATVAMQVDISPTKNFIPFVISGAVCTLFLLGLLRYLYTKRAKGENKDPFGEKLLM